MGVLLTNKHASLSVEVLSMKHKDWASQTWLHIIIARVVFEKKKKKSVAQAVSTSYLIQDLWKRNSNSMLSGGSQVTPMAK